MKIVIAGAYAIGTYLAKLLARDKHDITLISGNSENLEKLSREYDILTMDASPSSIKIQKEAGVEEVVEDGESSRAIKHPRVCNSS